MRKPGLPKIPSGTWKTRWVPGEPGSSAVEVQTAVPMTSWDVSCESREKCAGTAVLYWVTMIGCQGMVGGEGVGVQGLCEEHVSEAWLPKHRLYADREEVVQAILVTQVMRV